MPSTSLSTSPPDDIAQALRLQLEGARVHGVIHHWENPPDTLLHAWIHLVDDRGGVLLKLKSDRAVTFFKAIEGAHWLRQTEWATFYDDAPDEGDPPHTVITTADRTWAGARGGIILFSADHADAEDAILCGREDYDELDIGAVGICYRRPGETPWRRL